MPVTSENREERGLTMPVALSIVRESVSTATTCGDLSFHGQYFLQFAVDTSSHE